MTQLPNPPNSGAPTPVQGVTGGPPVMGGQLGNDPTSGNVVITPNPGNVVQLRKGNTPQAFQVYEYFHSNTDYSRIAINTQPGGPFQVAVETQPPSVIRDLNLISNGVVRVNGLAVATLPLTQIISAQPVTSGPNTTSNTLVDLAEMTVTITPTGGRVLAYFSCSLQATGTTGNGVVITYALDGAEIVPTRRQWLNSVASQFLEQSLLHDFGVLSQAAHTIKVQWLVTGAGTTITSTLLQRELIVVEFKG